MLQEDKELLLKDLCARLPYGVIVEIISYGQENLEPWFGELSCKDLDCFIHDIAYKSVKPYLRPMSSMTEEEKKDLLITIVGNEGIKYFQVLSDGSIDNTDETIQDLNKFNMHWVNFDKDTVTLYLDWLNRHHIDYRGLIEKGLALEAPNDMYKI
jgi:hypothetical protein